MAELTIKSPIQFQHSADGQVQLVGRPDVPLKLIGGKASAVFPEWERTLGLPTYEEEWEELAKASGLTSRYVRFILCDESPTRHVGNWRLQPAKIRLQPRPYLFTLGHTGFVIGGCYVLTLLPQDSVARALLPTTLGIPDFEDLVQGDCIIGQARLYDSPLADIAWRGLRQEIFSHTCAVLMQNPDDPDGAGDLAEVALTSEVEAGCPGARILKTWEA